MNSTYYKENIHNRVIKELPENSSIICSFIGGSFSWKSRPYCDIDVIVVVNGKGRFGKEFFIKDTSLGLIDVIIVSYSVWIDKWAFLDNKLIKKYPENLLYGKFPQIDIDSMDFLRQKYEYAKKTCFLINNKMLYCNKGMYWVLMAYYSVINDSFEFASKQMETIQKCHDQKLPISYCKELKQNIEKLLGIII